MANWSDLKASVASIVKTNGSKEITGQLLQNVLNNIISNVGLNSTFAGIATPETNPGTPDGNVFYIASDKGTYSNFNAITIEENEVNILEWKGISWQKKDIGVPTKERLNQLEQNLNESINKLEETTNTKVGSALNQIESLKSTVLTYKLESYNNLVLRGTVVGTQTLTKDDPFSTSEYISIYDNASKILYTNTYDIQRDNYFVGIALYNKDRNTILYVGGGTGEVNLKDYPEAKYFRYCCGDRFDINQCSVSVIMEEPYKSLSELTTALEIVNTQIDSIEESISSSEKYKLNSYNSQVLRGDAIGISTFEGFSTSDYIEIKEGVKYIIYENTYEVQPGNYFAGFVLYNANRNLILYVGGDTGQVEISKYPEAKFFRYCCQNIKTCQVKAVIVGQKDESGLTFVNKNVFVDTIADTSEYITDENGEVWVGYDKVFEKNGVLGDYKISLYNCSEDDLGVEYKFVIGTIDQRNWLLPRLTINKSVDRIEEGLLVFDFSDDIISIRKNEVIFIKAKKTVLGQSSNRIVSLHSGSTNILYTNDLYNQLQPYGVSSILEANIKITAKYVESYFASNEEQNEIKESLSRIESTSSKKQDAIIIDQSTGVKYKIIVNNGELSLKQIKYSNVLFIGNSFTIHGKSENVWECDGRSMAASTDNTMYAKIVAEKMELEADRSGLVDNNGMFERVLSNFNYSYLPNKSKNYDAIVVQLGENIIETDTNIIKSSFRNLFTHIKDNWKNSDVYAMIGTLRNATVAIAEVASEMNIPLINCGNVSLTTLYQQKDYYIGSDGVYYELADAVYRSHPSDIGMYNMAEKIVEAFGGDAINDKLFNITLNQSNGGTISTASNKWVEGGVVTVRCVANSGKSISSLSVISNGQNISAVKRLGTYTAYTFIMPKSNVTITPEWI